MRASPIFGLSLLVLISACSIVNPPQAQLPVAIPPTATVYYIRPDGGDAGQCTGLVDAAYPGTGSNQACAWDHPFRSLPPGGPARILGGDAVIIANGSYRLGYGAQGADSPALCNPDNPWDCQMAPVPGGPDAEHPTMILGEGWGTGCKTPPELWGAERVSRLFDLSHTSNAIIACLELTDHATCAEGHPASDLNCQRGSYPYGNWASIGIYAEDSSNIRLVDLNIHGLASAGIQAGRLKDWQVEDTRLAGNGWVGWDGDLWEGSDSNTGTLLFSHLVVEWNGCVEGYKDEKPHGCWAQPAGGYGDGLGTGETGGHWVFEDSAFLHNTSDGLDLTYGSHDIRIDIRRTRAEGNAGNQIKTKGLTHIENAIIIGNCAFFSGKSFTARGDYNNDGQQESAVDDCRAYGNALSIFAWRGNRSTVTNSSLTSQGDCLVEAQCAPEGGCEGSENLTLRNDLFVGQPDFTSPGEATCLVYSSGLAPDAIEIGYSLVYNVKDAACPGKSNLCDLDPLITSMALTDFDPLPLESSPLLDAGRSLDCPATDFLGLARPQGKGCDIGALELLSGARFYFPLIHKQ